MAKKKISSKMNSADKFVLQVVVILVFFIGITVVIDDYLHPDLKSGECYLHKNEYTYAQIGLVYSANTEYRYVDPYEVVISEDGSRDLEDFKSRYPTKVDCVHYYNQRHAIYKMNIFKEKIKILEANTGKLKNVKP